MSGGGGAMVNDSPWREISWASNPTVREAAKQDDETTDTAPSDLPPSLSELVKGRAGNSNFGRAGLSAAASGIPDALPSTSEAVGPLLRPRGWPGREIPRARAWTAAPRRGRGR